MVGGRMDLWRANHLVWKVLWRDLFLNKFRQRAKVIKRKDGLNNISQVIQRKDGLGGR